MTRFNPSTYGTALLPLLDPMPLSPLGPGTPNESLQSALAMLTLEDMFPALADRDMGRACLSGLWLLHDFLDESHHISQDLSMPTGSYWHAIMHRREPDASNSKYWWRQVGSHPVLATLKEEAPSIGYSFTSASDFVDFCERVRGTGSAEEDLARRVQLLEWQLLFDYCWKHAQ